MDHLWHALLDEGNACGLCATSPSHCCHNYKHIPESTCPTSWESDVGVVLLSEVGNGERLDTHSVTSIEADGLFLYGGGSTYISNDIYY